MLKKLNDCEVKPEAPFDDDALQRQESVELLTNLVESTHQPFVLSVEAPWGFGKTRFIKIWKAYLESKKHICLYFNAWENDFVDDPLVAFLGEMNGFIEKNAGLLNENERIKTDWADVKRIGGGVLRKTLPLAIQIATHGLLNQQAIKSAAEAIADDADTISEFASTLAKERLEKYETEKEGISAFRESLEKLASEITESKDGKPPLIFFVDELDRCRPDFAVALLERIKHLFNVKKVIFVLAIDRGQMNECVKVLYGINAKSDGYLRRFIDFAYQLPEPGSNEGFAAHLFNRFSFNEFNFDRNSIEVFLKSFSAFSRAFGLSLRAQEQCFTGMNIVLRTNPKVRAFPVVISFLATLQAFRPGIIGELRTGRLEIDSVLEWISNIKNEEWRFCAEAALRTEFSNGKNANKQLLELNQRLAVGSIPSGQEDAFRIAQRINYHMSQLRDWQPNVVATILSYLELSSRFR
jgi:hypothetical protein